MELNYLTPAQKDYFERHYEESNRINVLKNKLISAKEKGGLIVHNPMGDDAFRETMKYILEREQILENNLKPFYTIDEEFQRRKNEIIEKHGYSTDDLYDEDTMKDISALSLKMNEEISSLPENLKSPTKNQQLESMFIDNNKTNEKSNDYSVMFK